MYNRKRILLIVLALFSGWSVPNWVEAQNLASPQQQLESTLDRVNVEVVSRQSSVIAGGENEYAVIMNIEDGWHLNAHDPTHDYLIGVNLTMDPHDLATVTSIRYPDPLQRSFEFAGDELDVYEDRSVILVNLKTSDSLNTGSYKLDGILQLQACSDKVCLPPADVELTFPFSIGDSRVASGHDELFQKLEKNQPEVETAEENTIAALFNDHGFFWMLIGIFFIGLALNLTPCVYPMISVTISLFGSTSKSPLSKRLTNGLLYLSGIVFMYSSLGATAAFTGGLFGSWLQNPWVTGGIGVFMLLLALSMFGLYELQPPAWMVQKLGKAQQTAGHIGHFLSGLLVGIFAAPCIGPPIIALLAFVGTQANPLFGFITFFVLALGLGLPYLFLATFSGSVNRLPKSGDWMIWVKKIFGIILVGIGLFYLSLVLLPGYTMHVILIVLVTSGIYLGFLEGSGEQSTMFRWVKPVAGITMLLAAFMLFQNLQKESVEWEPYDEVLLRQAVESGEPVMLDFYADWCIPCIEMDRRTFTDREVINRTKPFIRLKVDLTHFNSELSESLRKQYNIAGVPTLLFLDPQGNEISHARVTGFMEPEVFLEKVESAKQAKTE